MEVLNVKVEKDTVEKLDRLVKRKAYKNKSEAVRSLLEEHFKEHPQLFDFDEMKELLKQADEMSDEQFEKLAAKVFKGTKTAAQMVAEGRERS